MTTRTASRTRSVINLGDGTSNSGLNRIIGVLSQNGADYGLGGAAGTASIETGGATAVGTFGEHPHQAERDRRRERTAPSS